MPERNSTPRITVVFVHDFLGSCASAEGERLWPDITALREGKVDSLALSNKLLFDGLVDLAGGKALPDWGHATHIDFKPFFYDWRHDIDKTALALGDFIESKLRGGPAHLLAHGMGGLVCRSLIRQRPDLWNNLATDNLDRGGRLVFVGTPHEGCFDAAALLTGDHPLLRWIDILDPKHDARDIAKLFRSFPSVYQMLPTHARCATLHDMATWQKAGIEVSAKLLAQARTFQDNLARTVSLDPERVACVAGVGTRTRVDVEWTPEQDHLSFRFSQDGDGLVAASMAFLPGIASYEAHGAHISLLRCAPSGAQKKGRASDGEDDNKEAGNVATAQQTAQHASETADVNDGTSLREGVAELLRTGATKRLARLVKRDSLPLRERAVRRQIIEGKVHRLTHALARSVNPPGEGVVNEHEAARTHVALALEGALIRVAFGDAAGAEEDINEALTRQIRISRGPVLRVKLLRADITQVNTPMLVVAHYAGAPPTGSEADVDLALGGWIKRAILQRVVSANLGEAFLIPSEGKLGAKSVMLVGKGPAGHLGIDDLRYMAINVAFTAASLGTRKIATVALGTGRGELPRKPALRALVEGLREGLLRWIEVSKEPGAGAEVNDFEVSLIEIDPKVHEETKQTLTEMSSEDDHQIKFVQSRGTAETASSATSAPPADQGIHASRDKEPTTRITIEEKGSGDNVVYRFSALGETAAVPLHEVSVQPRFLEELTRHLYDPTTTDHERFGRLLCAYFFPDALKPVLQKPGGVTLVLDREAAALPWEMACVDGASGTLRFGLDFALSRQLRTQLTSAPAVTPSSADGLRVLVIADPAAGPKQSLPDARREGEAVFELFEEWRRKNKARCRLVRCIGPEDSDPLALLDLLLQGDFDVIHFSGHGTFDAAHPDRSGWVLGDKLVFTAREMFRARRVPRLVFASACWSSALPGKQVHDTGRGIVGLAEAFMSMGVENYIGAARPVSSHLSAMLAVDFYRQALDGESFDKALCHARKAIYSAGDGTWGAFQLYGAGSTVLPVTAA